VRVVLATSIEGRMKSPVRVLLADDDDRFVAVLTTVLESDGRFEVVGRTRNGHEAVELASTQAPDVVLLPILPCR
jgi:chemotaxis response regulator CheB